MNTRIAAWLIIAVGFIYCRVSFLEDVIYNVDEAEYAVAAAALEAGWLPGVDLLGSTKPPGIVLLYAMLFEIFGRSMAVLHVAHLAIALLSGIIVSEIGLRRLGMRAVIPVALMYVAVCNCYATPAETLALNVESPGMLFALAGILVSLVSKSSRALVFAAFMIGVGSIFRQSILLFAVIPLVLAWGTRRGVRSIMYAGCGLALAWLPILVWYGANGGLGWAWDSWVRYPTDYASDVGLVGFYQAMTANFGEFVSQALAVCLLAVIGLWIAARQVQQPTHRVILVWLSVSIVALSLGSRFYGHYFYQIYPVLALLGALAIVTLWHGKFFAKAAVLVLVLASVGQATRHFPNWYERETWHPARGVSLYRLESPQLEQEVAAYIMQESDTVDCITVWGYCPQLYYFTNRLPGTRDYLCHYVTGYSPQTFDPFSQRAPRPNGHPLAEQMFVQDLIQRRPLFVVDLVRVTDYEFPFLQYSILDYPQLRDYLRAHYRPETGFGNVAIYRRVD